MATTKTMFEDLHAAQMEMPAIQATAINPAYRSRYVTLEELLDKVLPVLSAHNFVFMQMPTHQDGKPALRTVLMHGSGEVLESTMLLVDADTSQHHGAALTYARRYSLTAWLGLTADTDDDAQSTVRAPSHMPSTAPQRPVAAGRAVQPRNAPQGADSEYAGLPLPACSQGHGEMKFWPSGVTKNNKVIGAQYKCQQKGCDKGDGWPESIWADKWLAQVQLQTNDNPPVRQVDMDVDDVFE